MINNIRTIITNYITNYGNTEEWEETRFLYSVYAYVSFLVIVLQSLGIKNYDIEKASVDMGLESQEIIRYLFSIKGAKQLSCELLNSIRDEKIIDINALYQKFLSVDFAVRDKKVVFDGGKNNRDILGSYYTQESFAYEITQKAVETYLNHCDFYPEEIRIADFSCGGGAFLNAAKQYCAQKGIRANLFGADVDPIAVMITRARLYEEGGLHNTNIVLGNPLLRGKKNTELKDAFEMALKGRFYHCSLGIRMNEKCDIILGNPPWEKIRFEEKKFLGHYIISERIDTKYNRSSFMRSAAEKNKVFYTELKEDYKSAKSEIKKNSVFENTKCGELNTYALFTEFALKMIEKGGIIGLIVKSSLLKMPAYSKFMKNVMNSKKIYEVYMFINKNKIFNIDSREEFSIVYFKDGNQEDLKIAVNIDNYKRFYETKKIVLTRNILKMLNPETGMIPNFRNNEELEFLCRVYSDNPTFDEVYHDSHFGRLVHLTNHSQYIINKDNPGYLPIYEGKFVELYTGKYATFRNMEEADKYKNKAAARVIEDVDGSEYPEARFYIFGETWNNLSKGFHGRYIVAWRSLTSATNRRTMLATILPLMPTCQSIQFLQIAEEQKMLQILAVFNSIIFDYIVRLKMAGLDLTQAIIKQIPVPNEQRYDEIIDFNGKKFTIRKHIISRLRVLYREDVRINNLFENYDCYAIENGNRKQTIAELDILIGRLYKLEKAEIKKIASRFDKYYTKDEVELWF